MSWEYFTTEDGDYKRREFYDHATKRTYILWEKKPNLKAFESIDYVPRQYGQYGKKDGWTNVSSTEKEEMEEMYQKFIDRELREKKLNRILNENS
jgi:hypothetical protein